MSVKKNDEFVKGYEALADKLSFITVNEQTINLLKNSEEFKTNFEKMLVSLMDLETKLKIEDKKSIALVNAYHSITNTSDLTQKPIEFEDADDIEDNIHFLDVYMINTFGEEFLKQNHIHQDNMETETYETKIVDGEEVHNFGNRNQTNQEQTFNAEEFLKHNNVTPEAMADEILYSQARYLLQRDISQNKVFQYDSKPKIVIFMKMLNLFLFAVFGLSCFIFAVMEFVMSSKGMTFISSTQGGDNGPFIPMIMEDLMVIFGLTFLILCVIAKIYNEIKYFKNDNYRYNVKLSHLFFSSLIFILFIVFFTNFIKAYAFAGDYKNAAFIWDQSKRAWIIDTTNNPDSLKNSLEAYNLLPVLFAFIITAITSFCSMFIVSIILMVIRPKIDRLKMQQLLNQYVHDIKSGNIKTEDISPKSPFSSLGSMMF